MDILYTVEIRYYVGVDNNLDVCLYRKPTFGTGGRQLEKVLMLLRVSAL